MIERHLRPRVLEALEDTHPTGFVAGLATPVVIDEVRRCG